MMGGIVLDMATHMNRVLGLDIEDQTVTVEAGISGPALEAALNEAMSRYGAPHAFTCGHFPQSFEYSTVGGWVVTRGAGQNSTYYGKIEQLIISQHYVTPIGEVMTLSVPAQATGPDVDQIMIGSEGSFGVLVAVTLRVCRYRPKATRRFSFFFSDWQSAYTACREIMQDESGLPSVLRLSDPEETAVALQLYGLANTPVDKILNMLGYRAGRRCLLVGTSDGSSAYTRLVAGTVTQICGQHGALSTGSLVTRRWEASRFQDPYLRDELQDLGVVTDTLECAVSWSTLERTWAAVREVCHARPKTICMTHASHFYPQGANLYFIFIARIDDMADYLTYQASILDAIRASGAALSHHHGIGKLIAPWLPEAVGGVHMGLLRAIKDYFDPRHIMNPGGTLALDLPSDQERSSTGVKRARDAGSHT